MNGITSWLLDASMLFLLSLLAGGTLYALALLLVPVHALRLARFFNRQFSSRRAMRPLEIPRSTEAAFYRHHRGFGIALLLAVAFFFLFYLLEFPDKARIARGMGSPVTPVVIAGLETFFVVMNVLIGLLALVVTFRPSLLKPIEARANRWISLRRSTRALDTRHEPLDRLVERRPRLMGLLILGGVIYITLAFLVMIV